MFPGQRERNLLALPTTLDIYHDLPGPLSTTIQITVTRRSLHCCAIGALPLVLQPFITTLSKWVQARSLTGVLRILLLLYKALRHTYGTLASTYGTLASTYGTTGTVPYLR